MKMLKCMGLASGEPCDVVGQFLEYFDPDAYDGRGEVRFTVDRLRAKHFETAADALRFWNMVSPSRPTREDGKPNKPLTAFHMEIEDDGVHM